MQETIGMSDEIIKSKILLIRGKRVMIDRDLAELYGVTTKRLNEQVKRNPQRFPDDFMFQLTEAEKSEVVAICDHLQMVKFSRTMPYAFSEHGAVMLASVLNSERAIAVNIQILRIFTHMREALLIHKDILLQLEKLEGKVSSQGEDIQMIFDCLRQLMSPPQEPRTEIGFRNHRQ
ncbi:ORF6N domain-containing protein [Chitinophaga sp. GCM10012297]|uniref:ORF6N domain-containing protein n=1 Tax=Chitinophaga chungangae TaxID=2821488 RepID=A0ABS3YKW7_9BACT|nr:ORF6N domain-containing protein [Chitinophaga chungangae]MBO9155342.1 ORF6N domain-containing protein [Chitinophaga chungangae]